MTIRKRYSNIPGIYFITFTCFNWLRLFEITNSWAAIYTQFDHLKKEGHHLNGYVLMPNHLHALIKFNFPYYNPERVSVFQQSNTGYINYRIGTMKRFLAYHIINSLKTSDDYSLLLSLNQKGKNNVKNKTRKHKVFESSFDCKECFSEKMVWEKLKYIHHNPCKGKWKLAQYPSAYMHSSAYYYEYGSQGYYPVQDFRLNR